MEIKIVGEEHINAIKDFLLSVPSIKDVDESVIKNMVLALDNEIIGCMAFEKFNTYGLIRYFVFKKGIEIALIEQMLNELMILARSKTIKSLFSIVINDDIESLFKEMHFTPVNHKYFFIDEENIDLTKYKDASIMIREISLV